jgi:hypothetical protein
MGQRDDEQRQPNFDVDAHSQGRCEESGKSPLSSIISYGYVELPSQRGIIPIENGGCAAANHQRPI